MRRTARALAVLALLASPASALESGMEAEAVIGQPGFTSFAAGAGRTGLGSPQASLVVGSRFYLCDQDNNRVLIWNKIPVRTGEPPDAVIGQTDFSGAAGGTTRSTMNQPSGLASDGRRLAVCDTNNNRVLIYNELPTASGTLPDVVVGQQDFVSGGAGSGSTGFNAVWAAAFMGGRFYAADFVNNRVLGWNGVPQTNGAAADFVLGQPDFATTSAGTTDRKMFRPDGLLGVGSKLLVADFNNNRVLVFSPAAETFEPADVVIGQPNFTSATARTSADGFRGTYHMASDGRSLFVTDYSNRRVMGWSSIPETNGVRADFVLGQPFFETVEVVVDARHIVRPGGIAMDGRRLYVSDELAHRVLIYRLADAHASVRDLPQFTQGKAVLGKVFSDADEDGVQDEGERGLEGVKVVSDTGIHAVTDSDGKYHFPYVETGQRILKIDEATLPAGAKTTTESPRKTIVTEGVLTKISFGVKASGETPAAPMSGPLLKVTITEDPVLLEPVLRVSAARLGAGVEFTFVTNYSEHIAGSELRLFSASMEPLRTVPFDGIPGRYRLPAAGLPGEILYQVAVRDGAGREDRSSVGRLVLAAH
jgi:hypothetical protein